MNQRDLFVFAHIPDGFVPAGRVTLTEEKEVVASSFAYGLRYLDRPEKFEIDPVSLSLDDISQVRGRELYPNNALTQFGGIRNAAPDAWGRRVIEALRKAPADSLSEAEYLLEAGSDRVGALDLRTALDSKANSRARDVQSLGYMLEAAERVELGLPIPANLEDVLGSGPTAGGARPKATVRDNSGLMWLAKFPAQGDMFNVAHAECFTLKLAKLAGLTVPDVKIQEVGSKSVVMIRRFDRYWQAPNAATPSTTELFETLPEAGRQEQRLPFVSGLTLIGCSEFESPLKGYADLARAMRRYVHPSIIRENMLELFARMVFNIFVTNDDDHLRNHGFVRDPRLPGWQLSPLYDVVPRPGSAYERYLHLQVGNQGKLATLDNALSEFSAYFPKRETGIVVIRKIWEIVREWKGAFEQFGASGQLIDKLSPAFRELSDICSSDLVSEILAQGGE